MTTLKEELVNKNIVSDDKIAESLIMAGKIKVNDKIVEKPGTKIAPDAKITIIKDSPYVSRGGFKLEGAFKDFGLDAKGKKIIDVGASTGGFTDFLLQNRAHSVVTIDVGYGILSWKLRNDPAVTVMERTNIRNLDIERLPYFADLTVADVSFISLKKVFEKIYQGTKNSGEILLLVKPQFEVERHEVENKGVIKSSHIHKKVLVDIFKFLENFKCSIEGLTFSKIKGAKGNQEYWIFIKKNEFKSNKTLKYEESGNVKKTAFNYDKIIINTIKKAEIFFNNKESQ